MKLTIPFHEITQKDRLRVGGKAYALSVMSKTGLNIPKGICITTEVYHEYVESTGLRSRIIMELYRKPFGEMRWEEIWDAALRIRNLFLNSPMLSDLQEKLMQSITSFFSEQPVSVRSSAPGEDSAQTSFAGLHESYVNILSPELILEHVRLVWASLWSDRAILYRQELGLDVEQSAMAVIVQKMVFGERSGVVFGINPMDKDQAVVESVYGLNQGLVDGSIEPDRWIIDRTSGAIESHHPAKREKILNRGKKGVRIELLPPDLRQRPPLEVEEVSDVFNLALKAERLFRSPQDMEWTYTKEKLHTLQARPITTRSGSETDERPWYLSLHRSFENLKDLRLKIENELIPAMEAEAAKLDLVDLSVLSHMELASEIGRRETIADKWQEIYKQDCIPFAHGMRLFARVYNDIIKPEDPFEFMELLRGRDMASIKRNRILLDLAGRIRKTPGLLDCLKEDRIADCDKGFRLQLDELLVQFGDLSWGDTQFGDDVHQLYALLIEMGSHSDSKKTPQIKDAKDLENKFLDQFDAAHKAYALELIDLARASYQLRDDDNIYIGKIQGQVLYAIDEGRKRIANRNGEKTSVDPLAKVVKSRDIKPGKTSLKNKIPLKKELNIKARQIVGQPAGPGVSIGRARVIHSASDLFGFKEGEILVCDAIDPGMTFVVPLAAGIVERRGGMLIHGAIIAREYGIPCVTGAPNVAAWIETGDTVTVDGYLGIVIVGEKGSATAGVSKPAVQG